MVSLQLTRGMCVRVFACACRGVCACVRVRLSFFVCVCLVFEYASVYPCFDLRVTFKLQEGGDGIFWKSLIFITGRGGVFSDRQ